jgi:hypothetical protein
LRHQSRSPGRSSRRRALSQWSGSISEPIAAWRRWIGRSRSANSPHSAPVPRSPTGGSDYSFKRIGS